MDTTYDVRIWSIQENARARGKSYVVRWRVAGRRWKATFKTAALADSFRSVLLAAARKGEAFDTSSGRPVSMLRASKDMSWYGFACAYADLKWPRVAATTRRTHAEALTTVTTAMLTGSRGKPNDKLLRAALKRWAFNTARRDDPNCPEAPCAGSPATRDPCPRCVTPGCSGRSWTASRSDSTAPQQRRA
jgi:hypothetical protein